MARLLDAWRRTGRPVFIVQHLSTSPTSTLRPHQPGCSLKEGFEPRSGELLIQKHVNSAFLGTELEERLRNLGCAHVVIAGLTTPHCVSTTARMAGNLGFATIVVEDAVAAFDLVGHDGKVYPADVLHAVSLATLSQEFATILSTDEVLAAMS
jgi:nicotinamidase-related amidase